VDGAEVPEILLVQVGVALVLQHAGPVLLSAAGSGHPTLRLRYIRVNFKVLFKGYNCEIFPVILFANHQADTKPIAYRHCGLSR
jgi:hypothetical protein